MGFFPKSGVICGIQETGLLRKEALTNVLGTFISPQKINSWLMTWGKKLGLYKYKYIKHDDKHHMIVLAPTRSGKGVGLIVPTLLGEWKGSCIVTDIKGENWGITAGYRQKVMGTFRMSQGLLLILKVKAIWITGNYLLVTCL